jgi:hypothetical protein
MTRPARRLVVAQRRPPFPTPDFRPRMLHFALSLLLLATAADPGGVEVTRLDGSKVVGQLTTWDARGVTLAAAEGAQLIAGDELLQLRATEVHSSSELPEATIELVDGTQFPIKAFTVKNRKATVATPFSTTPVPIATELIRRVEFRASTNALAETWNRVDSHDAAGDVLIVMKGAGEAFDFLTGVVDAVTDEQVSFDWDGQKVPIKRTKVAGIAFYQREKRSLPDAICVLTMVDGTTAPARSVELDGDTLSVVTPANLRIKFRRESLASADFSSGKLAFLSDLKPDSSTWVPRIAIPKAAQIASEFGVPRMNSSFSGSALSLAWPDEALATGREVRTYAKGLALRSRSELTYRLPTGMKRFTATAGIDPATTEQGHVVLEIRADDRVVWEGEIDGKQPPINIDVELKSARRLQILVDYGRNLDYGDRLHLVEARVTK